MNRGDLTSRHRLIRLATDPAAHTSTLAFSQRQGTVCWRDQVGGAALVGVGEEHARADSNLPEVTWEDMHQGVTAFTTRAAEKLRQQSLVAEALQVFIQTHRFRTDEPQYANAATCELAPPTNDTFDLIAAATALARRLWRNGFRYAKAGVILSGLTPQALSPRRPWTALGEAHGRHERGQHQDGAGHPSAVVGRRRPGRMAHEAGQAVAALYDVPRRTAGGPGLTVGPSRPSPP